VKQIAKVVLDIQRLYPKAQARVVLTFGGNDPPDLNRPDFDKILTGPGDRESKKIAVWKLWKREKVTTIAQLLAIPEYDIEAHICIVELGRLCNTNAKGEKILPDGTPWMTSLMTMVGDTIFYIASTFSDDPEVRKASVNHLTARLGAFFAQAIQNFRKMISRSTQNAPKVLQMPKIDPNEAESFNSPEQSAVLTSSPDFLSELARCLINIVTLAPDED